MFKCPTCGEMVTYLDKDSHSVVVTDVGWFKRTPQHCIHCGGALYQDDRLTLAPARSAGVNGSGKKKSNDLGRLAEQVKPTVCYLRGLSLLPCYGRQILP